MSNLPRPGRDPEDTLEHTIMSLQSSFARLKKKEPRKVDIHTVTVLEVLLVRTLLKLGTWQARAHENGDYGLEWNGPGIERFKALKKEWEESR
jgi:hypothetical protein